MISETMNPGGLAALHTEKLYDMCMIERLCHQNTERIQKLVAVFIDQVPRAMEEIKLAYAAGDLATVRKTTHRIKPTLSYYAIVKIEKDVLQIEKMAKQGIASAELELKIARLDKVLSEVVQRMKQDFFNIQ